MNEKLYAELLMRLNLAHKEEFFLESSWLAYSILEDRLLSLLADSGGVKYKNHKPIRMMGKKLEEISKRSATDGTLADCFPDQIASRIHEWKEQRNALVHTIEHGETTLSEMTKSAKRLSIDSKALVHDVSKAAKKLKSQRADSAA